jgi:hypothetical protein
MAGECKLKSDDRRNRETQRKAYIAHKKAIEEKALRDLQEEYEDKKIEESKRSQSAKEIS